MFKSIYEYGFPLSERRIHQFGAIAYKGIHGLKNAMARADGDVLAKAPHSCEAEKCEPWPENP